MYNLSGSYTSPQDDVLSERVPPSRQLRDKIPARLVLYFLSWSGFLVSFMMRNDMNFALVAMMSNDNSTKKLSVNESQQILDSIDQWRRVFEVSAIISILTYLIYQFFGTAEIQTWNKGLPVDDDDSDEGKVLSTVKDNFDNTVGPI
ncbi:uncharacterized protein LOC6539265 isoform X5 [Drosophila yakuba]|uniref:Uncharacterized protein, isoform E n=1 Tax=Drosophila yakuba TaxID=7245 RepID=A0A0R1E7U6_DROYA|nr:uncharacterized protein LOC6539265 isoform X5 [Drosophila yakuba]KRK05071.1 uncharacterized protein Dyak_GE25379, isoform E [Drosophila yakuba]